MFNEKAVQILTQINGITDSVILKYPKSVAVSESQDMQVLFDLSEIDSDPFPDLGFKDSLGSFLNLVKLFPEGREISVSNNVINVQHENTDSSFITEVIALMDAYDKDAEQFTKTEGAPSVSEFDLTVDDLKKVKSATSVFKDLTEVVFKSQDGDMKISLAATNKFNAKSNTFSVVKSSKTSKEFEIKIPVENFKMIPSSEYSVHVKYNSERDSYRIIMLNKSLAGLKILMTVKV
jgi:hypothetical protein